MSSLDLIDAYTAWQRSESRSKRTVGERRKTLIRMDEQLPYGLAEACEDELRAWLYDDETWSASTRLTYYGAFADFYRWAQHEQYLSFNPAAEIGRPKPAQHLPNPVTDAELAEALAHARQPWLLCIQLAAYAGCRCMDIANLHRERITQTGIRIIESKGGAARVVPTHPIIWEAVADLPPGPLTDMSAEQISVRSANYLPRTLRLHGVHMHRFRHWFAGAVQRLYKDLRVTQYLMGHRNPATTAGYALVADESNRAAIDLLPVFAAGPLADAPGVAAPDQDR